MIKLALTTLGCPDWDLPAILSRVPGYGADGLDLRGLRGVLDITTLPEFTIDLRGTAARFRDAGLTVCGLSTSIEVCDPARRDAGIEEAKRYIPIAHAMGTRNIRILPGGVPIADPDLPAAIEYARGRVEELLALPGADALRWNFETHGPWPVAARVRALLDAVPAGNFGVAWDVTHTYLAGYEFPADCYPLFAARMNYAHLKDAVYDPDHPHALENGWRYVLPGAGDVPLKDAIRRLAASDAETWALFEHEKRWHPELEPAEVAFPAFIAWARSSLASLPI